MFSLEDEYGIFVQVTEVDLLAFPYDLRMLLDEQPADVGEKETSFGVVGIGIGLGILVVDSVVPGPLDDVVLKGDCLEEDEKEAEGEGGLEGAVRPEAVTPGRHTDATDQV